jgi:hypothetical protein
MGSNRTKGKMPDLQFPRRYGAWALIAGASSGLGAAYARALAARGMNLVISARRKNLLQELGDELGGRYGVEVLCVDGDLGSLGDIGKLRDATKGLEVAVLVYNAAYAPIGEFVASDPGGLLRAVSVNVQGPVALLASFLPPMVERGRGAVILMSSLAGNQGSPRLATYAASKSFNRVLAEGLWPELKAKGIDILACVAGAIRTPGYASASVKEAPGTMDPERVAEAAIRALGRGPVVVPGFANRLIATFMGRLLTRKAAISIMAGSTQGLRGPTPGLRGPTPGLSGPTPGLRGPTPGLRGATKESFQ